MNRPLVNLALLTAAIVLSFVSFVLVLNGATDEPYEAYRANDAFEQLVIGTALIALWCCYSVVVVTLVATQRITRDWLVIIVWAAICVFYLSCCPLGYVHDLDHFIFPSRSGQVATSDSNRTV